jgi:hypothetical protein
VSTSSVSSRPKALSRLRFAFQMVRLLEMSFCAVWDILENNRRDEASDLSQQIKIGTTSSDPCSDPLYARFATSSHFADFLLASVIWKYSAYI